jgi:hypothetical protein
MLRTTRVQRVRDVQMVSVLLLTVSMYACVKNTSGDSVPAPIHTAAVVTLKIADSVKAVQDSVIAAQSSGAISTDDASTVLLLCIRLNQAGLLVDNAIRGEVNLSSAQVKTVSDIVSPLADAVQKAIATDVVRIKDPATQQKVQAALVTIQTAIIGVETALRVSGN